MSLSIEVKKVNKKLQRNNPFNEKLYRRKKPHYTSKYTETIVF